MVTPSRLAAKWLLALAGIVLAVWMSRLAAQDARDTAPLETAPLEITFLDVGQADAVVVRDPGGQTALIDAGRSSPVAALRRMGVERIDLLVATHPHADHIGGMVDVIEALPVRFYMDNGEPHTTATYARLLGTLEERTDITYLEATPRTLTLGSTEIEVLPMPAPGTVDLNDRSVALRVGFGAFQAILSGDSEVLELTHLVREGAAVDVTLLKAPHHGSDNGFTAAFLAATRPEVVVVSVGGNSYGHPRPEALAAYGAVAEEVYRTDVHGHVTVLGYEDGRYEVRSGGEGVGAGRERADARDAPAGAVPHE